MFQQLMEGEESQPRLIMEIMKVPCQTHSHSLARTQTLDYGMSIITRAFYLDFKSYQCSFPTTLQSIMIAKLSKQGF